jgi:hypothetical protein
MVQCRLTNLSRSKGTQLFLQALGYKAVALRWRSKTLSSFGVINPIGTARPIPLVILGYVNNYICLPANSNSNMSLACAAFHAVST